MTSVVILGLVILGIILIGILVVYYVALWKLFKKAGRNGWEAIVPLYNIWVLVEISGLAWWYALILILIPLVSVEEELSLLLSLGSLVINYFVFYNISLKLHKDGGFAILMTLFPVVMIPVVAFSDNYQFDDGVNVSEHGPIDVDGKKTSNDCENYGAGVDSFDEGFGKDNDVNDEEQDLNRDNLEKSAENQVYFCSMCGNVLKRDARYCGKCGYKVR